jgi:signal transduction histidine kinase/ligand-binding sensor domain-containing protein
MKLKQYNNFPKNGLKYLSALALTVLFAINFCDAQEYKTIHFNTKQGLHNNLIKGIGEDNLGFIWIASDNGLERFDGLNFKTFPVDLPASYAKSFYKCRHGDLFAVFDFGVVQIFSEPDTAYIKVIARGSINYSDTALFYAKKLYEDSHENLWISDNNSVWKLKEGKLSKYNFGPSDYTFNFQRSFSVIENDRGDLYVFSQTGYLHKYDYKKDEFTEVTGIPKFSSVDDAYQIADSRILVASYTGVSVLDLSAEKPAITQIFQTDACSIQRLSDSVFLIASWTNGIYEFEITKNGFTYHRIESIESIKTNNLFLDSKQNIWVSTDYGVILCQKLLFSTLRADVGSRFISSIDLARDGKIYCIAGNLFCLTPEDLKINQQQIFSLNRLGNLNHAASSKADPGTLYVATNNAQLIILKNGKQVSNLDLSSFGRVLFFLLTDFSGNAWACLDGCKGVVKIGPDLKPLLYDASKGLGSRGIVVRQDSYGSIYVGGTGDSTYLFRYNPSRDCFENISRKIGFGHNRAMAINDIAFRENQVLLASSEGLIDFGDNVTLLDKDDAFKSNCRSVAVSRDNFVWFSNDNGLFKYFNGRLFNYDENDGLNSNYGSYRCLGVDRENRVWIGTPAGLNYSGELSAIRLTDKPILTEIQINDRSVPHDTAGLRIRKHSYISIHFISLTMPGNEIVYETRLGGQSVKWSQESKEPSVIFPNLGIGNYTFEVRAKQHGSYDWSEVTKFSFSVLPLWYETWWAFLLYLFSLTGVIILINSVNHNRLIKQKRRLEILVKEHTKEIVDKNDQLQLLNTTKDKFFSIIAHDLKSPFAGILGLSDYLVESFERMDDNQKMTYISAINSTAQNTSTLLENLLVWARTQTNSIEFKPVLISLEDLIKSAIEISDAVYQAKNIKVKYKIPGNISIHADINMLTTVLRNLLSNAVKYSHKNESILIDCIVKEGKLKVSVIDHGVGIDAKRMKDLFTISEKSSTPGTENERGTGLGLILCREFIGKHGGIIGATSVPGAGSTFWFEIPVHSS